MPTKNCVDCGKEFYTRSFTVRCAECRTARKKVRDKRNHDAWISDPENYERHRQKVREHYQNNRDYYREYQRNYYQTTLKQKRKQKQKVAKLDSTVVEVDGKKLVLYECPRMKVKSAKLPCGDRWECFDNGMCELVPKGKEEITFKDAVISVKVRPIP